MVSASRVQRPPAQSTGYWMAGTLLCALLFIAVYLLFVLSEAGQLIDVGVRVTVTHFDHPLPVLDPQNRWIAVWILAPPAAVVAAQTLPRRRFTALAIAAGLVAASNITTQVVKHWWLQRPELIPGAGTSNALPSGHTTMAASAAVAVFLAADARRRPLIGVLAAVWGAGWGTYIFLENWHRPSDMVAAYLVVAGWGLVVGWLVMRYDPQSNTLDAPVPRARLYETLSWAAGALLSCGAVACLYAGGGWAGLERTLEGESNFWHWLSGLMLSAGPAFLAAAVGIRFFHAEAGQAEPPAQQPHGELRPPGR